MYKFVTVYIANISRYESNVVQFLLWNLLQTGILSVRLMDCVWRLVVKSTIDWNEFDFMNYLFSANCSGNINYYCYLAAA